MKVKKKDIILFEDSFNVQHVARVTSVSGSENRTILVPRNVSVIILMSIEESTLNTGNITENEVIMIFENCDSIVEVEDKYPEVWIWMNMNWVI